MKRLLMLFLCICLISGTSGVFASNQQESGFSNAALDSAELLIALDLLDSDYTSEELEVYGDLTRADFAYFVAKIFAKNIKSDKLYFHDVPRSHWAFNSVSSLVDMGIIKVNDDRMFYSEDKIRTEDALRMLLRALGYKNADESTETVLKVSKHIGLTDNVAMDEVLDIENACILFKNALLAPITDILGYEDGKVTYKTSSKTYLEEYYSTYFKKGILEAYDEISLTEDTVESDMCIISGERFYVGDTDMEEMLGCSILYLYTENKHGDKTVIWAKKFSTENGKIIYSFENNASFDKDEYRFVYTDEKTGNEKSCRISKSVNVVYNGEIVETNIEEVLSGEFYSATLVRNSSSGTYDTVIMWNNENYIIGGTDKTNMGIYDKISGKYCSFKNADRVDIYSSKGDKITFDDLKNDDIISVYTSLSGERVKIVCSNIVVSGEIETVKSEDGKKIVTVGDVEYMGYENILDGVTKAGKKITLYIDANGYVAYAEYGVGSKNVGYLIKLAKKTAGFDNSFEAKIFDESGKMLILESAQKVSIDEIKYDDPALAYSALGGEALTPQLVAYEINSDGLLKSIETAKSEAGDTPSLHLRNEEATYLYRSYSAASKRLGSKMHIGSGTVIFGIPNDLDNEDDFRIVKSLSADTYYANTSSYALDEKSAYEEYIVIKGRDWFPNKGTSRGVVVTSLGEALNNEGNVVECIIGYQGSSEVRLICDDSFSPSEAGVKAGDYLTCKTNGKSEITSVNITYSPHNHDARPAKVDSQLANGVITTGYVHDVCSGMVRIGSTDGSVWDSSYNLAIAPIVVYDVAEDVAQKGSIEDLVSYKTAGENCSFVLLHSNWGVPIMSVIYK
ncbi:MAG: S-layer homology domain-containing protein [Eubacteriales bacterium]|nr:S-layer homology domain-containing protein [Eubacteriales bacterium]